MSTQIKNDGEALDVAVQIIREQDNLLAAYRVGVRPQGKTLDILRLAKPRLDAYLDVKLTRDIVDSSYQNTRGAFA